MKIMLIQPKMRKRPMDTDLKVRMAPPLGLLTLISLTPDEHEVILVNENVENIPFQEEIDLVGITITLDVLPRAMEIAKRFQALGVAVVAGGIHVTCNPEECKEYFDAICVGPAERVWAKILKDKKEGRLQKVYQDMTGFRGEEIASPAYAKVDKSKYLYTNVVTTSRGCPNRCHFCYNSCQNRTYVVRPLEAVMADIEALGTKHILFIDDNFIGTPAYTRELLKRLKGRNFKWSAAVTTRILDYPDLLDLMAETGCQSLFIGFESINNTSLAGVAKDNQFEKYERLATEIHRRGIMVNASMVFGLDGDGPDVFARTLNWLVQNKIETLTSHIFTPYPGTELYRRMEKEGRIINYELSNYNTSHVVFQPKGMTPEELYQGYLWMYKKFYSFSNILRRLPKAKQQIIPYLLFNFVYRKYGSITSALTKIIPMGLVGRSAAWLSYKVR